MASSPHEITPVLNFEVEEARILQGTKDCPLTVFVEESGSLAELANFLKEFDRDEIDVLHLSGHAEFQYGRNPRFIMESEFGEPEFVAIDDIARQLQFMLPKLIFLSCCRTAQSPDYLNVDSMAEILLHHGAKAVLGWGHLVADSSATMAAAELYKSLAAGFSLLESLAITFQNLYRSGVSDWHLLRLFLGNNVPGAFVKRGRKRRVRRSVVSQFIDPSEILRVATRERFVGRRRQIQSCLRHLKSYSDNFGIVLHGMGGLGKSTVAARLCDRMEGWQPIVWWRTIDEPRLVKNLAEVIQNSSARNKLLSSEEHLRFRLLEVLETMPKPLLLVFDDFEWNLYSHEGIFELEDTIKQLFKEILWAFENSTHNHRIIITTRYDFDAEFTSKLIKQPLDAFRDVDLEKKLIQLTNFDSPIIGQEVKDRAIALADGNPRLLEFLNDEVLSRDDASAALEKVEQDSESWKNRVIWEDLYAQIDDELKRILGVMDIFHIHVPKSAVISAAEHIGDLESAFERGTKLGLIEASNSFADRQMRYRVPKMLTHIISGLNFPGDETQFTDACRSSAEVLYDRWGKVDNRKFNEWLQIFTLVHNSKPDVSAMRQWFSKVLAIQFNEEADRAFEIMIRQNLPHCEIVNKFAVLEHYLEAGDWKRADEETAWLFIQEMVLCKYSTRSQWMTELSNDFLEEVDGLWVKHSGGRFGFSIQKKLYSDLVGEAGIRSSRKWSELCLKVGWIRDDKWIKYSDFEFDISAPIGHLPVLATARGIFSHSGASPTYLIGDVGVTVCLFGSCGWRIGGQEPYLFSRWASGNF